MSGRSGCGFGAVLAAVLEIGVAVPAQAPPRFHAVLWCGDPARAAVARDVGCDAVQLPRGGDPAPLAELGLGYYLDQPIGKGLLELRDAEWQPLLQAYERARDPAALVRPTCFATPGLVAARAAEAAAEAARVRGPGLRFVALADEASATRHDAPLDTCRCEHCAVAFREFLRRRLQSLDAANQALGTFYASWDDVALPTTDQVRRRELGDVQLPADLRPFALRQEFVDEQFAAAVQAIATVVRTAVPDVPVGLTGLQVPGAFGGNDLARLAAALTLAEPYAIGGAPELVRAFAVPGTQRYATLFAPAADAPPSLPLAAFVRGHLAAMAVDGLAGCVVWNDVAVAGPDRAPTPFGIALRDELRALRPVLDACAGATVVTDAVWMVESQASVRVWWMLDSAQDGLTWIRRLGSYEREHSTSQAARLGWLRLLQDLGIEPRIVAESDLPERLLRERPRCLVLPATIALSDRCVQAIEAWVRAGGTLLADHGAALYDDTLRRRDAGGLDGVFGITERSLAWRDLLVREGRSTARERGLPLAELGLKGGLGERRSGGEAFLEAVLGRGRAVYLNAPVCGYDRWRLDEATIEPAHELRRRVRAVLQLASVEPRFDVRGDGLPTCLLRRTLRLGDGREVLAVRLQADAAPALLQRLGAEGPRRVQLLLRGERELRRLDAVPGEGVLGNAARFDLDLDPFGALLLEVVR
ncbi:MAG: beta-galactosidase [Planctomycetes bacterium]|nr:beta-galactosidase [Planctomycetota bacterium]